MADIANAAQDREAPVCFHQPLEPRYMARTSDCSRVSACGATPFLDEAGVEVGRDFEGEILDFLDKAHELLVLLTPWALDRPYIWAEVGAAWGRRIPIIPVLHGLTVSDLESRVGIPVLLKKRDMIELNAIDKYFEELKMRVEKRPSEEDLNA